MGDPPLQIGAGVRYWAKSPETGSSGWVFRLQLTLLYPR
jgi:hypothetical protein